MKWLLAERNEVKRTPTTSIRNKNYRTTINVEAYRSGHNGPHSKCGYRLKRYVGSNPTASAKRNPTEHLFGWVFFLYYDGKILLNFTCALKKRLRGRFFQDINRIVLLYVFEYIFERGWIHFGFVMLVQKTVDLLLHVGKLCITKALEWTIIDTFH